ncbi:hypothetical protein BDN72DRAFT_897732 [Pluteus cervinus]|uniref:Uncharacterized protein n=1 Tax=Pluteus cervinus TaxID=181527 RepID=A0ACD3ASI8_9AGAR|nr:hypothetical protein BDN72DRAFT_897732 [Pluteus cervinus]
MQSSFSSQPLPRSRPLGPPANTPNRASNALRASVLDVALQLGIGDNNMVTNWMFNNTLDEEEEPQNVPYLTRSPNTSEESSTSTSTSPYTPALSYLNFHSPPPKQPENPYSTERELTAFKDLLDSSGFAPSVPTSGPIHPGPAAGHAAITFPETLPRPVTPKKLRKKRTGGDSYDSDAGYVSETGKKKDSSAGGEPKDKEERKRKKSLAAITKAAVAATSSKKDKDTPAAGYETDATPSKASKSKDKKKKKSKTDPEGAGYETDAGYISSVQTPSKAKRFFRLGSKASKPDLRPEVGDERPFGGPITTEPLSLPPIAGLFATTLGSRAPSPLPPPVPAINPLIFTNNVNTATAPVASPSPELSRESYASGESGSSGAGPSVTSAPATTPGGTFRRRFGFLNRDQDSQPAHTVPVSPHSPLISETADTNAGKLPIISLPLHRPATSPVITPPTHVPSIFTPSPDLNLRLGMPRRPGTADSALGPQGLRVRAPSPSPSPLPSPLLTPSSYVMVTAGEDSGLPTPVPEVTTLRGRPNLRMQTDDLKKSPPRNGPLGSPSAYHDIPPPSPAPIGPLPSVPVSPPSAGPSIPLIQRGRESPFPAKPLNAQPPPPLEFERGGNTLEPRTREPRYQGLAPVPGPAQGWQSVGLPTSPLPSAMKMTGVGLRRPVGMTGNPNGDVLRPGDEEDEYADGRELRDVLDRFSDDRAKTLTREKEAALGRRRSFEELKRVEQEREPSGLSENIINYYGARNAGLANRKQAEEETTTRRPLYAEEEEGEVIDDDDRSHYPDDRETLYYEEDLPDFPTDVRESRWTESIYSRASILDTEKSESTREKFLRRIGEMYDENGREKIPPVPPLPSSIAPVPKLPQGLEYGTSSKSRSPETSGSTTTPGRNWNRF